MAENGRIVPVIEPVSQFATGCFSKRKIRNCAAFWPQTLSSKVLGAPKPNGRCMKKAAYRLYLERRRLSFVAVLAFLAGAIGYLHFPHTLFGLPAPLVIGLIYVSVITPFALLVCLFLPRLRFMIEAVAVSRLLFSVFVFAVPEIGYKLMALPSVNALIVVTGGVLLSRVLHGRILRDKANSWIDRVVPRDVFVRAPAMVAGNKRQVRFTNWVDGTQTFRA